MAARAEIRFFRLKRVILLVAAATGFMLGLWWLQTTLWNRPEPIDPVQIREAIYKFYRERMDFGFAAPPTVTLGELVKQGYLRPEAVRGFGSTEVTFSLKPDAQNSGSIRIEARLPDGSRIGAFANGSIQQLDAPSTNR